MPGIDSLEHGPQIGDVFFGHLLPFSEYGKVMLEGDEIVEVAVVELHCHPVGILDRHIVLVFQGYDEVDHVALTGELFGQRDDVVVPADHSGGQQVQTQDHRVFQHIIGQGAVVLLYAQVLGERQSAAGVLADHKEHRERGSVVPGDVPLFVLVADEGLIDGGDEFLVEVIPACHKSGHPAGAGRTADRCLALVARHHPHLTVAP